MKSFRTVGLDFGNRRAGTTVLCRLTDDATGLLFSRTTRGQDADRWLHQQLAALGPVQVFIDAPLSLPGVYHGLPGCDDYFFRAADRDLRAMSPLFLGGLTARAMQLAATTPDEVLFQETYPSALARCLRLDEVGYKKTLPDVVARLARLVPVAFEAADLVDQHHVDALLAWLSSRRFAAGSHETYGTAAEGRIYV